jgi:hypothetical protein
LNLRPLGYEHYDVRLSRLGRSLTGPVTSADGNEHSALVLLCLLCLIPSRAVWFTNRFTYSVLAHGSGVRFPGLANSCALPAWT